MLQRANPSCLQRVRYVFLVSGVYDLRDLRTCDAVNAANLLGLSERNVDALSPIRMPSANAATVISGGIGPPKQPLQQPAQFDVRVLVAEHDSATFREHSRAYADAACCNFNVLAGCDHFDIVERLVERDFSLTALLIASAHSHV